MADYFFPTVVRPIIPRAAMTGAELLLLTHVFQSEPDGDGLYLYAEQAIDDMPTIAIDDARAALDDDDRGAAAAFLRERLAEAGEDDAYLQLDGDAPWETALQEIVRRSDSLPRVTVTMSFTCTKMRPDAFGGLAMVITGEGVLSKSTDDVVRELSDALEQDAARPQEAGASTPPRVDYPLRLFFDCSTAHLSPSTRAYLAIAAARSKTSPLTWTAETPFGWFVWVEDAPEETVPADLAAIMRHAQGRGAEYVLFDSDAPENPQLPILC